MGTARRPRKYALTNHGGSSQTKDINDEPSNYVNNSDRKEKEQELWDAFREEYTESIEQLPLSLHRNFTLMNEFDREVRTCKNKLLPALREYVVKRQVIMRKVDLESKQTDKHLDGLQQEGQHEVQDELNDTPNGGATPHAVSDYRSHWNDKKHPRMSDSISINPFEFAKLSKEEQRLAKHLPLVSLLSGQLLRASEEKVSLAQATYDSIDRHVRLLDQAIKEHEARFKDGSFIKSSRSSLGVDGQNIIRPGHNTGQTKATGPEAHTTSVNSILNTHDTPHFIANKRLRRAETGMVGSDYSVVNNAVASNEGRTTAIPPNKNSTALVTESGIVPSGSTSALSLVLSSGDMPIDPHEPRYCYCNQVSWGEVGCHILVDPRSSTFSGRFQMIACDAEDCEREWFHLGCAGLAEAPKGKSKWYCDSCKEKMVLGINRKKGH